MCVITEQLRVRVDNLLATVLHHQETWNQQVTLTNELMREMQRLSKLLTESPRHKKAVQIPLQERSVNFQSLVSKISADIRQSLCDIEQRQNQVSHLELDLSSVRLVLESAQQEIEEMSKTSYTQDVRRKVNVLISKLKKQISNALTKANNLVNTYANTKNEFINSSERILQLQKEWENLEQEVRCHWEQISKDFNKPKKTDRGPCPQNTDRALCPQKTDRGPCPQKTDRALCPQKAEKNLCPSQAVLAAYEQKCPGSPLLRQYKGVQKALKKEDAALKVVKRNVMDLKSNITDRDKLTDTQEKTICLLQNSLKRSHNEAEQLRKTIECLEVQKCEIEIESNKNIHELECKISKLQDCLTKYSEANDFKEDDLIEKLQNANLELAALAANLHEDCRNAYQKIDKLYDQLSNNEKKFQKNEKELQLVIANLKEDVCKEQMKLGELQNKYKHLEHQLENSKKSSNPAQDKSINLLENSLKALQQEVEKLSRTIKCLESKKAEAEKEHKEQIQKLQSKICELQNNIKLSEDVSSKHHKSEAALQIVIAHLKEAMCKERKKYSEIEKENSNLREQVKEIEDCYKNASQSNQETQDKIADLKKQVKCWSKKASDLEDQVNNFQEKLCKSLKCEKELEQELSSKDMKYKEEICKKQKEINELTKAVQILTEKVGESQTELDATRMKNCETELKLQSICEAYEELKLKQRETEAQSDKLQMALTQLSNKFVSRRLDTGPSQCVRYYQEECAKYEALYNTTASKLRSKELEISSLKQDVERLKNELDHVAMTTSHQKDDESCPFLMERVHQLSKELQNARSSQNSYESILKELRENYSKKEEENFHLKTQIKQLSLQRDTILSHLDEAQQEIHKLKITNSNLQLTIKRLEEQNTHVSGQLHKVREQVYESEHSAATHLQPNIELQREISTALTSQLRGVKQKLHSTKHDYKLLQAAYDELNRKYTMLQRGERDLEQIKETKAHCRPCMAKSSKSVTYLKMPENTDQEYLSHSKSWHKMDNDKDLDWKERRWKRKLQEVIRGDFDTPGANRHSSSSN